jgi:hypothetical protein
MYNVSTHAADSNVPGKTWGPVAGPPQILIWLSCLLCLPFLTGHNPLLAGATIFGGLLICHLVWREGESQYPLFVCIYQLFQVFAPIVEAEMADAPLSILFGGREFERATWLSLAGVIAFSAGMALPLRKWAPISCITNRECLRSMTLINIRKLLVAWAVLFIMEPFITGLISVATIDTAWRPIGALRMAAALLIFQSVFVNKTGWWILIMIVVGETVWGFFGFFSTFKIVYFLLLIAAATYLRKDHRLWLPAVLALAVVLVAASFWQIVKSEYRQFLNQGETQQVVNVSVKKRYDYLGSSLSDLNADSFFDVFENSLRRLGYINYFGYSLIQVPENIHHTGGRLWIEAIGNITQPRILFPDKQVFNDSDRTNEFTGLVVADASKGTSIGIGYVGESYIDFGVPWMFIPIALFGMAVGFAYAHLVRTVKPRIFGIGIGTSLLFSSALLLESSNAKMLGGLVSSFAVYLVFLQVQKGLFPKWFGAVSFVSRVSNWPPTRWWSEELVEDRAPKDPN